MASACVNNSSALTSAFSLLSPRASFSRDENPKLNPDPSTSDPKKSDPGTDRDGSAKELIDFEFRLDDPVAMLTADELFSDGKLVPLQLTSSRPRPSVRSPDPIRSTIRSEIAASDPSVSSPKAPKCSSRWRELLGLKKLQNPKPDACKNPNPNPRSIKNLFSRSPRSIEPSLSLPLLRDSDSDSLSLSSSRPSLSSTSSSSDSCDFPRLSLDFDKPTQIPAKSSLHRTGGPTRARSQPIRRAVADAESPRMNSSGKVVFYSGSLERSSSSPSSFNGGGWRVRPRGMERSFSANVVRVNPVLNVPVCTLRGSTKPGSVFGFFSKKEREGTNGKTTVRHVIR